MWPFFQKIFFEVQCKTLDSIEIWSILHLSSTCINYIKQFVDIEKLQKKGITSFSFQARFRSEELFVALKAETECLQQTRVRLLHMLRLHKRYTSRRKSWRWKPIDYTNKLVYLVLLHYPVGSIYKCLSDIKTCWKHQLGSA